MSDETPQVQPTPQAQPTPTQTYPEPKKTSGLAVAALVLGIVALIFSWIPFVNAFAIAPGVLAIIFGLIGFFVTGASKPRGGKGLAISGLVLGIIAAIIFLTINSAVGSAVNTVSEQANSEYAVTIDSSASGTDYSGNPAIIITYTFTNNSDKDANFTFAISDEAFQNGVELSSAVITDGSVHSQNGIKDIKPGATITVQQAYSLIDTSEVTVECSALLSFNNEPIASAVFPVS
jgi:hypothetical protein